MYRYNLPVPPLTLRTPDNPRLAWGRFNEAHPQADLVTLNGRPSTGNYRAVNRLTIITAPGQRDSDGVSQPDPFLNGYGGQRAAMTAMYYPSPAETIGDAEVLGVDFLPVSPPDTVAVIQAGTASSIRTDETPGEVQADVIIRGLDPEVITQRGHMYLDGAAWRLNTCQMLDNTGALAVNIYRRL